LKEKKKRRTKRWKERPRGFNIKCVGNKRRAL